MKSIYFNIPKKQIVIISTVIFVFCHVVSGENIFFNMHQQETTVTNKTILEKYKPPYDIKSYFMLFPGLSDGEKTAILDSGKKRREYTSGCLNNLDVIDYKNGYLRYSCHGDGGGDITEMAYWILNDKTRRIGVNYTTYGMCCPESKVEFYTFTNNVWKVVTKKIFPVFRFSDFMDKENLKKLKKEEQNKIPPIQVKFPKNGMNIEVSLGAQYDDESINAVNKKIILYWQNGVFIKVKK